MSHLAEVYAKDLGVKIGNPIFKPHFFPIVDDNYITIHTDNNVQSKHYDYWDEVITIVKKNTENIKFIQIGSGREPIIQNADKFIQTNSIKQSSYIIERGLMHVGIDSAPVHIASVLNKPIVAIYAHTYAATCCPLWGDKSKQIIIESHRDGEKPSFSNQEADKKINKIHPEEIANAILKLLNRGKANFKTLFIGKKYKEQLFEVIPDHSYDIQSNNMVIRMDHCHNENNIIQLLGKNECLIVTKKPISKSLLSHQNIKRVNYVSDCFDRGFIEDLKSLGKDFALLCSSEENLNSERAKFFDDHILLYDESKKICENKEKIKLDKFNFSSFKKVLKNKKIHNSHYEANDSKNLDDFYLDLENMFLYTLDHEQ
jgi:hypothetical protein